MKKILLVTGLMLFGALTIFAQKSAVFVADGAAVHGYDVVAYFNEGKPVKGDAAFSYLWNSASWHFANQKNMDAFKASPEKFAPQYGGYCAYGMSQGHKASTDPQAWRIADGKLYLNYNKDVQQMWFKKQPEFIEVANKNWPALKDKE